MIIHVDMDAFFASVEQRDQPELQGLPVVVGGDAEGRGVVSAASYEARKFGIHSAMPTAEAKRRCPDAVFLHPHISKYADVSAQIHEIFNRYTPRIEPISLDEAFLDASGSVKLFGPVEGIARRIKQEIHDELSLTASAGVAPNKFLAKIASDLDKPDGFVVVPSDPQGIQAFLDPLPIERIWGVGRVSAERLHKMGLRRIAQIRRLSIEDLHRIFGQTQGDHFYQLARGVDDRDVIPDVEAKSISNEITFAKDTSDHDTLRACLLNLTDQVARRLRHAGARARGVRLKIRLSDFRTMTRSRMSSTSTDLTDDLWATASSIFEEIHPTLRLPIRLIGMGVYKLEHTRPTQRMLFDEEERRKREALDRTVDRVRDEFGLGSLRRAAQMDDEEGE
jgi:DNA polymerase IV